MSLPAQPSRGQTKWWKGAIYSPLVCPFFGLLYAICDPQTEGTWSIVNDASKNPIWIFFCMVVGLFLGAVASCICSIISALKGEVNFSSSLKASVPSVLLLAVVAVPFVSIGRTQQPMKYGNVVYDRYEGELQADPTIAMRERWFEAKDERYYAFRSSFGDPTIHYTEDMLKQIYDQAPTMRDYIFLSPACSREFLVAHYSEAYDRSAKQGSDTMLESIVSNANTPIELVQQVVQAEVQLPYEVNLCARRALEKRKSEMNSDKSQK
jgi:hypothetical protein